MCLVPAFLKDFTIKKKKSIKVDILYLLSYTPTREGFSLDFWTFALFPHSL